MNATVPMLTYHQMLQLYSCTELSFMMIMMLMVSQDHGAQAYLSNVTTLTCPIFDIFLTDKIFGSIFSAQIMKLSTKNYFFLQTMSIVFVFDFVSVFVYVFVFIIIMVTFPSHSMVKTKCWPGPVLTSMCGVDFLSKSPGFTIALCT